MVALANQVPVKNEETHSDELECRTDANILVTEMLYVVQQARTSVPTLLFPQQTR